VDAHNRAASALEAQVNAELHAQWKSQLALYVAEETHPWDDLGALSCAAGCAEACGVEAEAVDPLRLRLCAWQGGDHSRRPACEVRKHKACHPYGGRAGHFCCEECWTADGGNRKETQRVADLAAAEKSAADLRAKKDKADTRVKELEEERLEKVRRAAQELRQARVSLGLGQEATSSGPPPSAAELQAALRERSQEPGEGEEGENGGERATRAHNARVRAAQCAAGIKKGSPSLYAWALGRSVQRAAK
tara:strand:- start:278 stop:1024 length:747 start_codon:yes stop_codon:yes gene_type:complete